MTGSKTLLALVLLTLHDRVIAFVTPTTTRVSYSYPVSIERACASPLTTRKSNTQRAALFRLRCSSSGDGVREGLIKKEFGGLLEEGNVKEAMKLMKRSGRNLKIDMSEGRQLLNAVSRDLLTKPNADEEDIIATYSALKSAGLLKAFGSIDLEVIPSKSRTISPMRLMELTGLSVRNLAPGRPTGAWLAAGAGLFGVEYIVGTLLGMNPLQTIIPFTIVSVAVDRLFFGGALSETFIRGLVPGYREKIVRHEAGHFLVAYLLGCPVQGCLLDPFEVGRYASSGAQGGTVFADPAFAKGVSTGKLTRSSIDRFSIVLMGGIAAEALHFGNSEGGSADEGVMIEILSTISPPFNLEQIKSQALWAAVQAVLLIKEHKDAYEVLVSALDQGKSLGECVNVLEAELSKKPLPGDIRREDLKPPSVADEVKAMMVRRMQQRNASNAEERRTARQADAASTAADQDDAMLSLQRRVEELERSMARGDTMPASSLKSDEGGVWMNDLRALRQDIMASFPQEVEKSDDQEVFTTNLKEVSFSSKADADGRTVSSSENSIATADTPRQHQQVDRLPLDKLRSIETKAAANAKRMAEVEARIRQFEEGNV